MGDILTGVISAVSLENFILINVGILIGTIFGAIPGLNANIAMVLFLPMTFNFKPLTAMIFLLGIYTAGKFGGSISAILIGTPGTNAAAVTLIDGYPLGQRGHAKKAIHMALTASCMGSIISASILLAATPLIGKVALMFGPPEYFVLGIFGLTIIAAIAGDSIFAGIFMGAFGFFLSTIGLDKITGEERFVFDNVYLLSGLNLMAIMVGCYAMVSFLTKVSGRKYKTGNEDVVEISKNDKLTLAEIRENLGVMIKSSLIGTAIGATPGAGAVIAAFLSYSEAKRTSKHPEEFGHGALAGVAAPEAGNSSLTGSCLIPLLTLGIPGAAAGATLIAALQMHGLPPGPTLLKDHGVEIYVMILALFVIAVFMYIQCRLMTPLYSKISVIPQYLLIPNLIVLCIAGVFSLSNSMVNLYVMLFFGIMGYLLRKFFNFPVVPMVLGFILGPISENNLRRALSMSRGNWSIFVTRPICIFFILLIIVFMFSFNKTMKRSSEKADAEMNEQIQKTMQEAKRERPE